MPGSTRKSSPTYKPTPTRKGSPVYKPFPAFSGAAVSVDYNATPLLTIPPRPLGANTHQLDTQLDATTATKMAAINVSRFRYQGGQPADKSHPGVLSGSSLVTPLAPFVTPGYTFSGGSTTVLLTFDAFCAWLQSMSGARGLVTVNYGTNAAGNGGGSATEAAAWVKYAKATYPGLIDYWEIGNEAYLPQQTGGTSPNLWPLGTATEYGTNAAAFITAMRAQDATIKIAVDAWYAGGSAGDAWNAQAFAAMATAGVVPDAVSLHLYPETSSALAFDAYLMWVIQQYAGFYASVRSALVTAFGSSTAAGIASWITELNVNGQCGDQLTISRVNSLFAADSVLTHLEAGAAHVMWFSVHLGVQTPADVPAGVGGWNITNGSAKDPSGWGDWGLLSTGGAHGGFTSPPAQTPYPAYYGLQMVGMTGVAGDVLLPVSSTNPFLRVHACRHQVAGSGDTKLALLLLNEQDSTQTTTVSIANYTPPGTATVATYGYGMPFSPTPGPIVLGSQIGYGTSFTLTQAPFTMTLITQ